MRASSALGKDGIMLNFNDLVDLRPTWPSFESAPTGGGLDQETITALPDGHSTYSSSDSDQNAPTTCVF